MMISTIVRTGALRLALLWLAAFALCLATDDLARAQSYRFRVSEMTLSAYPQANASVRLEYKIVFENAAGAHAIDIVDIGLPHGRYSLSTMSASIDGQPISLIQPSEYIDVGVECHLRSGSIPPGDKGTFEFTCVMPNMVYADTTNAEWASFQIRPTWFDPQSQIGKTKLKVALHMPPGVLPEEVRYQQEKERYAGLATWGDGDQKHTVAYWESDEFRLSSNNPKFSVSFPRRVMTRVVEKTKLDLLLEWFDGNQGVKAGSGIGLFVIFSILYFRFSHGTGCVPYLLLAAVLIVAIISTPATHLLCWPVVLSLFGLNEWYLRLRKPATYLPAMATVEGGGIKRGLTAPQAAVLLEMPLNRILTMVVFGLLKKNVLKVVTESPLTVEVLPEFRGGQKSRIKQAAAQGIVLHDYENPFLDKLEAHKGTIDRCDLNKALGELVKSTADRMSGFDLGRTKQYYQRIVKRAWQDAESVGEIELRDKVVDRNFEWMMMEPRWTDLFEGWRRRGYTYYPRWSRPIIIVQGPSPGGSLPGTSGGSVKIPSGGGIGGGGGGGGGAPAGSTPSLSEVAGSFIGWAENTAGQLAKSVEPASMGLSLPTKGVLDLSGVDKVTGDFFEAIAKASASSGGGRGGGGGGCACACAGCACACACAGGGR